MLHGFYSHRWPNARSAASEMRDVKPIILSYCRSRAGRWTAENVFALFFIIALFVLPPLVFVILLLYTSFFSRE